MTKRHCLTVRELLTECLKIGNMNGRTVRHCTASHPLPGDRPAGIYNLDWTPMCGDRQHALVSKVYGNVIRFKEAARGVDDRLENWLQLIRRATNDVEHVAGRGLILKRFLQFSNQPRVLNRNDRLVGKGFDEVDLLACKGLHHGALQSDDADRSSVPHERNSEHRPIAAQSFGDV